MPKAPKKLSNSHYQVGYSRFLLFLLPVALVFAFFVARTSITRTTVALQPDVHSQGFAGFEASFDPNDKVAIFEGREISAPSKVITSLPDKNDGKKVLGEESGGEKWIEVNLTEQKLIAHEGDQVFLESLVATGARGYSTPVGEYRVWLKVQSQKMSGGTGRDYYYLPNVPYIMFFENSQVPGHLGYSLHGAYWHNDFGHVRSHGCVNLPIPVAEKLYYWTQPTVPDGKRTIRASSDDLGTRIVIHD
jgi:hypothetical protein